MTERFDWLETITDPTLRRIAKLEREARRLHRRIDAQSAYIRVLFVLFAALLFDLWLVAR